jgi:hypothetical protein
MFESVLKCDCEKRDQCETGEFGDDFQSLLAKSFGSFPLSFIFFSYLWLAAFLMGTDRNVLSATRFAAVGATTPNLSCRFFNVSVSSYLC